MNKFYLGCDVSKGYADFVVLDAHKNIIIKNFQLDDTFDGHNCLYENLINFFKKYSEAIIFVGVESTGGYENNWVHALSLFQSILKLQVFRLNPYAVTNNKKANMTRNTTDKISAQQIAEYLIDHSAKTFEIQSDPLASLKKQWTFIQMLTKQKTQLLNELESVLYSANPEILAYCKNGKSQWILKLLLRYPTALNLAKADPKVLAKIPYLAIDRAVELISSAKKSVASSTDAVMQELVKSIAKQILQLNKEIEAQTSFLNKFSDSNEIKIMRTFQGINLFSAVGLLIEIQSVERFSSAKKLASYFGLHPVYKISGDGISGIHMSKQGRKRPREILYMVALTAIRSNPYIKDIYLSHVQKGMNKMAAIGLCMHKILRIIYGMLKNNQNYSPDIDRENRTKYLVVRKKIGSPADRRLQKFDPAAPISRKQEIKRKEQGKSQSDNIAMYGINRPVPIAF